MERSLFCNQMFGRFDPDQGLLNVGRATAGVKIERAFYWGAAALTVVIVGVVA